MMRSANESAVAWGREDRNGQRGRDRHPHGPRRRPFGGSVAQDGPVAQGRCRAIERNPSWAPCAQDGPAHLRFRDDESDVKHSDGCKRLLPLPLSLLYLVQDDSQRHDAEHRERMLWRSSDFRRGRCRVVNSPDQRRLADDPRCINGPKIAAVETGQTIPHQECFVGSQNPATGPYWHRPASTVADLCRT